MTHPHEQLAILPSTQPVSRRQRWQTAVQAYWRTPREGRTTRAGLVLQLIGAGCLIAACSYVHPAVALAVLGVGLLVVGEKL